MSIIMKLKKDEDAYKIDQIVLTDAKLAMGY
jgi:hypothetical protein